MGATAFSPAMHALLPKAVAPARLRTFPTIIRGFGRLLLAVALLTSPAVGFGQATGITEAIRQLEAGDAFRAILTLNEVVGQPGVDAQNLARAHALRAMAFLQQNQPERAQAAVALALKAAPAFAPAPEDVNAQTIALFDAARRPRAVDPEGDARRAEQAGEYQSAFLGYLAAYQALPEPLTATDDRRLRESIIRVVLKLPTPPVVPPAAVEHVRKSDALLEAESILGGAGASSQTAVIELRQAVRIAPWWPEATFKLAQVSQKLQRVDEALLNLGLYRLADPAGYAASASKANPAARPEPARPAVAATVPKAVPATGTILIYRPGQYVGSGIRPKIECGGVKLSELQNGRTLQFTIPAGEQAFRIGGNDVVKTIEAGKTYYYRTKPGGFAGWNVREETAEDAVKEMKDKKIRGNDIKRIFSSECKPGAAVPSKR